jgi:3-(3-hydroxy-phenyl)propionate hydroxylase
VFDVTVVGFGPTGATLANLLGRDGLRTLVVERAPEIYTLPRAVHFDHEVMRIFQSLGLAERILPHTGPLTANEFRNADGKLILCFALGDTITSQGWRIDYLFHQPSLERVLREGACEHDSVEVRLGQELTKLEEDADGVTLTVRDAVDGRERTLRTRFLVGCDGASSQTRQLAGLTTEDLAFDEPWLVVDATVARPLEEIGFPRVVLQHCDPRRPTTVIPVIDPYVRWEFMLLPGEGLEMQEPERMRALIADWVDPDEVEVIRSAVYRFHALVGERWRTRRVFVAGDAAHQMPPFLGQGMCAGVRDAANLAWKLRLVLAGHAGDALLDTYQAERAAHVRFVIKLAVELGRIICTQDPEVARVRDERLLAGRGPGGAGGSTPMTPPELPGLMDGMLEPEPRHPLAGKLALQARVRDGAGREGLLDDVVGTGFTLLWRDGAAALVGDARALLERIDGRQVCFGGAGNAADASVMTLDDVESAYSEWFAQHGATAVLVRPDHAVFGVATKDRSANALLKNLASALTGTRSPRPERGTPPAHRR